jgi:hypothetical protein
VEFDMLGGMVAVRCPKELAHIVQRASGAWEPGSRRWLVERRRVGPLRPIHCSTVLASSWSNGRRLIGKKKPRTFQG